VKNLADLEHSDGESSYELRIITKAVNFLALLTGLLYLRVAVGDLLAELRSDAVSSGILLLFTFLAIATLGLLLSWRWEGLGGLLAILGGLGLAAAGEGVYGSRGWLAALLYSSPFIISGVLCLACWWHKRTKSA